MVKVDGVEMEGVVIKCKVCGSEFEVKPYDALKRKLCSNPECARIDVRDRMRLHRAAMKEKCCGCEVLKNG